MQEIYNILQEELQKKFGTREKVDELLQKLGEIVLMDLVSDIMENADEKTREKLLPYLNTGEMTDFLNAAKESGVNIEKYYEGASKRAIEEVFSQSNV
jgi:hypothetical protein